MAALKIGPVTLGNNLVMAPMAGITDLPFRLLAREAGAGMAVTEMISARALAYNDRKTKALMRLSPEEHPVAIQIFGAEPAVMGEAAKIAAGEGADIIDINMGCPVRKVVKTGAGSRLLENEPAMAAIMEQTVKKAGVPVTVKVRIGVNPEENIAPRLAELAAANGIALITVHGRAAAQGHTGKADLEAVAKTVKASSIPVIGNGGITDEVSAKQFIDATGCAGLMLGRGAIGDLGLFRRITHFLETGNRLQGPTWEERIESLERHAAASVDYYGEKKGLIILRKIAPYYLKNLPNASRVRDGFNKVTRLADLHAVLRGVWESSYFADEGIA